MLCPSCSKWIPDDFLFCNHCGNQVTPASQLASPAWPQSLQQPGNQGASGTQPTINNNPPTPSGNYNSGAYLPPTYNTGPQAQFRPQTAPYGQVDVQENSNAAPLYGQVYSQGSASGALPAPNRIQNLLIQLFQPALAANPWLGVIIGGLSPALLGALSFIILLFALHGSQPSAGDINSSNISVFVTTGAIPTNSPVRDGLQALLVAQGVTRHITSTSVSLLGNGVTNIDLPSPLLLTLLIPALFLMIGGYVAACTDMRNRVVASLWRGAAISFPYMLLLLLLATQVSGDIPALSSSPTANSSIFNLFQNATLSMNFGSLILLSLFWGTLFGMLGASFKIAQGHWRVRLHHFLQNNKHHGLTGILAGASLAVLLGCLLALLLSYTAMIANLPLVQTSNCNTASGSISGGLMSSAIIIAGPFIAVQLFAFSFGTPISFTLNGPYMSQLTDMLTATGCIRQTSFSLLSNSGQSSWIYLLLLLPFISLFAGGRVSAYLGRPATIGVAAIQGALIAIPFTITMMVLAALSMLNFSMDASGNAIIVGNIPNIHLTASFGVDILSVMVWSLLSSAFLGALGGIYQASAVSHDIDAILVQLGKILLVFAMPVCMIIDQLLARRSTALVRGRTLNILCGALSITLVLTALSIVMGSLLLALSTIVTYDLNHQLHTLMNALLIALPGLFLLSAFFSAILDNPQGTNQFYPDPGQTSGDSI